MKKYIKEIKIPAYNLMVSSGPEGYDEPSNNPSYGKRRTYVPDEEEEEPGFGW